MVWRDVVCGSRLRILAILSVVLVACESDDAASGDASADPDGLVDAAEGGADTADALTPDGEETGETQDVADEPSALALECEALASAVEALHEGLGEPPEHLRQEPPVKQTDDWDAMAYFDVLDALAMEEGYVLDWVYTYTGLGGAPVLYAREAGDAPFESNDERMQEGTDDNAWRPHVVVEDTATGYLQFAVLHEMADQFYGYWHAWQGRRVVCAPDAVLEGMSDDLTYSDELREQAAALDYEPSVTLGDDEVTLSYVVFMGYPTGVERRTLTLERAAAQEPSPTAETEVLLDLPEPGIP